MVGYWNNPSATSETIDRQGWLHTGDVGLIDEQGYLHIRDRLKDVIISGGENIYPAEIEVVLNEHPAVAETAVIGIPDPQWGEAARAIVVLKSDAAVQPDELIAWLRGKIAGFKIPKSIAFASQLPRTASGKVLKRNLREAYWAGRTRQVN
jgi:acyl-CoA synthetase (AMP-forming)/AMP-acid ligase II